MVVGLFIINDLRKIPFLILRNINHIIKYTFITQGDKNTV